MKFCPACAKSAPEGARYCDNCGYQYTMAAQQHATQFLEYGQQSPNVVDTNQPLYYLQNENKSQLYKTKKVNIVLMTLLLGWIGGHKYYLGKPIQGLLMTISCWTLIPLCISILEGIRYICLTPEELYDSVNRE